MSSSRIDTKGLGVKLVYSNIHMHPRMGIEMASLEFKIGHDNIAISFESWQEMIDFCDRHHFSYQDDRTGVEKYLARLAREEALAKQNKPFCIVCDDDKLPQLLRRQAS